MNNDNGMMTRWPISRRWAVRVASPLGVAATLAIVGGVVGLVWVLMVATLATL